MEAVTDLDAARARLLEELARVRAELGEEIEAPGQMTYGSQAAAAAQVFAQQRDLAFREQAERRFHAIQHALARIDAGTYTVCEMCGGSDLGRAPRGGPLVDNLRRVRSVASLARPAAA